MARLSLVVLTLLVMTGCNAAPRGYAEEIEHAHGVEAWNANDSLAASVALTFGENTVFAGDMTFETSGGRVRMELDDGAVLVFDGSQAWVDEAHAGMGPTARFHLLTWPYFVAMPFKLRDPGATLTETDDLVLGGRTYDAARLTFGSGIGDSPDDWYVVYRNPDTKRLDATGYIVTFAKDVAAAEAEPHAVVYGGWKTIDGVTLPTTMTIYDWTVETGTIGKPIGGAALNDLRFVSPAPGTYTRPAGSVESTLPGA